MNEHIRSKAVINDAHDNIDSSIKNGSEVARPLQRDLRNIMWEYGGVVKNESKLQTGLSKIKELKDASKNLDVRPDSEGFQDLMLAFDLEASLVSSEATLLSALNREESRGAHQRDDFKDISENENVNIRIELEENNELKLSKHYIPKLSKELQNLINKTKNIEDFEGMLLE